MPEEDEGKDDESEDHEGGRANIPRARNDDTATCGCTCRGRCACCTYLHRYACLSTTVIRNMFLDGEGKWRPSDIRLYEHHVQQVLECLFILFQIFPPLRGPEYMSVAFDNILLDLLVYV
jgi:hypothetical protein